jgi:hypothetical protein
VSLTPEERTLRARIAALTLHSKVDSRQHTEPARRTFRQSFLEQVDPAGELPEAERQRRADAAYRAHMTRLALKSARARRKRGAANVA